jgi:hypothetical protein
MWTLRRSAPVDLTGQVLRAVAPTQLAAGVMLAAGGIAALTAPHQIGLIALIDCIFFLLMFFMVATSFKQQDVQKKAKDLVVARRTIGAGKSRPVHDIPNLRDARYAARKAR